jgi:hypothetical protein
MLYGETQQLSTSSHPGIHLADYRTKLLEALKPVEDSQKDGMFIDGCFHHCQASRTVFWNGPQAPRINNKVFLITSPVEWTMGLILVKMTRLNRYGSEFVDGIADGLRSFRRLVF